MPTVSSTFTELYAPGLRKVIFESYTYMPTEYDKFINVTNTSRQFEEDYKMGGFGAVPTKPEGTAIVYDDPVPGSKITYRWTPYGKGFRVTHEAMQDDLYGQMRKMATALGRAFANQKEVIGHGFLNNAFSVANGGYDGLELCSTAHTLLRGAATVRNRPTGSAALGVTTLQDGLIDFERLVDESNVPIMMRPKWLIVSPELAPLAREILGSQFKPFTADNEINVLADSGLNLLVSHYITDTNAWFITADTSETDLYMFWREKFVTDSADDFDTGDGKMKGYMRLGIGYGDWRGFWGSPGT